MSLKDILIRIPLFMHLEDEDLDLIAEHLRRESYPKGTIIFREGEVGDTMYLVESGQVAVVGAEATDTIAFLGPGNFVGEISLLLAQPRTANLQVMIDAQLWVLNKKDFDQLIATRPAIALAMLQELSKRLVTTTKRSRTRPMRRITALLGGHKVVELAQALHSQLKSPVGLLTLPNAQVKGHVTLSGGVMPLGGDKLTETTLAENLSYQVEYFKHVLVLLPDQPDRIARKAIDLADTVVTIGPPPAWLAAEELKQKLWVTGEDRAELWRTARRLTNRTVGLALSSGGSRGLAHVGVIKVLLEENIPIDLVAGTSAGALFGAFFAAGWTWPRFEALVEELKTVNTFVNWDFNFPPRTAILKGRKARDKIIHRWVEGQNIEDLKTPFYIVAADIFTGAEVIFEAGSLADAIRASLSIPVLIDPWYHQGHYCVDGGIVNPLPASVLRDRGADIVIASNVVQPLRDSYGGRTDQMPSILQVVFNIFSAMEAEVIERQFPLIDVLIHHTVRAKYTLDFEQANQLVKVGELAARQKLSEIKRAIETPPEG